MLAGRRTSFSQIGSRKAASPQSQVKAGRQGVVRFINVVGLLLKQEPTLPIFFKLIVQMSILRTETTHFGKCVETPCFSSD
jgi:hypothetical protein